MIAETDWVAVSGIATAFATLVLALATFASGALCEPAARAAERSLLAGLRPLLAPSRPEDPPQKVGFMDDQWFQIPGGGGVAEVGDRRSTWRSRSATSAPGSRCYTAGTSSTRRTPARPGIRRSTTSAA